MGLRSVGYSKQPSILCAHSHQFPLLDLESLFIQNAEHISLARVAFPKLFDTCDKLDVLVRWVLFRWKSPSLELGLESAFTGRLSGVK
jgi:hypothetical protein